MEIDRSKPAEESLGTAQERLNGIYSTFLSFPSTDVENELIDPKGEDIEENRRAFANEFLYRFPKGTTTAEYTDQLSGKFVLKDRSLIISYAKAIHAGRVVLRVNSETGNAELKSFVVFQKNLHSTGEEWYSSVPTATRPHLLAIESLVKDVEGEIEKNPEAFKVQEALMGNIGETSRDPHELEEKKQMANRLGVALKKDLSRKREREIKKKNGNGRSNGRKHSV